MTRVAIACRGWVRCVELQGRKCNYWPASALLYWSVIASVAAVATVLAARSGGTTINPTTNPPKMYFCLRLARLFLISAILCVGKCAVSGVTDRNLRRSSRALRKVQECLDVLSFLIWRESERSEVCGSEINVACEFLILRDIFFRAIQNFVHQTSIIFVNRGNRFTCRSVLRRWGEIGARFVQRVQ